MFEVFPPLCDLIAYNIVSVSFAKTVTSALCKNLETGFFLKVFKNLPNKKFKAILNAFVQNVKMSPVLICLQKQLIDTWNMDLLGKCPHRP